MDTKKLEDKLGVIIFERSELDVIIDLPLKNRVSSRHPYMTKLFPRTKVIDVINTAVRDYHLSFVKHSRSTISGSKKGSA